MTDEQIKQAEALCERLRARRCGPFHPSSLHNEAATTIAALVAEVRRLREALDLAVNRLNRNSVDYIAAGNPRRYEASEWADEARAALENRHD